MNGGQSTEPPVVELERVTRVYGSGENRVDAVREISQVFRPGRFYCVLGPSGSGKSTLLHLAAALDRPTSGRVRLLGHAVDELAEADLARLRRRSVGLVFQFFNLIESLTVEENALLPVLLDRAATPEDHGRLDQLLERMGISARRHHLPEALSGGERQRAAIVRAMLPGPPLLLADEPTGALDSANGELISGVLKNLASDEGVCVIVVTHDLRVAEQADEVIRLVDGRLEG